MQTIALFEDGEYEVNNHGNPDLSLNRIGRSPVKSFHSQILFQLKNISQIEHTRHRSVANFMVNLIAELIAYTYQNKKPSLNLRVEPADQLPILV